MTGRVQGKVALVTGAARGQGRAHALRLAQEGADIIVTDIAGPIDGLQYEHATADDLAETVRLVEATGRRVVSGVADIRDTEALGAVIEHGVAELGHLDTVVANAGVCYIAPWDQVTQEIWDQTISINLTGTWNTIRLAVPHLVSHGGGSIVITSSAAGLKGLPFLLPYVASKHALTGMTKSLAHELAQHKIRVNSLHPGGVETAMGSEAAQAKFGPAIAGNPSVGGMLITSTDESMTQPSDQANAVLFLVSDEAHFVTAQNLSVDAGQATY